MILPIIFLGLYASQCLGAGINFYPKTRSLKPDGHCGKRLFLTPYIEDGNIIAARKASRVKPYLANVESYSGFLTINKTTNSNMFFWFFPAENNPANAPVALWLQGGPGAPSVDAIFTENGPFVVTDSLSLKRRKHYWSQEISVIYIDNPVGTGFSFTNSDGYVTNESEVGRDLYAALQQFFQLFPEYQKNDFFVTGESYAGKYIPAIAYTIHTNNPTSSSKINLKGIAIGDGLVDPENMMVYGEYLYEHGLIDSRMLIKFQELEAQVIKQIQAKQFDDAFVTFDKMLNGDLTPYKTLFWNATGLTSYFNYVTSNTNTNSGGSVENWLAKSKNRLRIHVGDQIYDEGNKVEMHLKADVMQSVRPWLEVLMDHYRVLLYNGQLDIIVAYPLTMNYVKKLQWKGKKEYEQAERKLWYVNGELAGYAKNAGNFTEILVRNAGHMVPTDQPLWALDMITKFTQNIPF
ncbi:Carboxypeptidase [Nesidiocoris tenuis]|uniref:Carboxypeptidase n=1 Tax=Nesidiocoris tenuis TaxID=355587 RepID=A0ABN7ACE2_9HEMI|nr:Carboxypeptidase [Nesidiocoris tenuis]